MNHLTRILRDHGMRGLAARAASYGGTQVTRLLRTASGLLAERLAMRLPLFAAAVEFVVPEDPLVTVLVFGGLDWPRVNRCLRALKKLGSECPFEIVASYDPKIDRALRTHRGVRLSPATPGMSFTEILSDAARQSRGRYLFALDSCAVATKGAIALLVAAIEQAEDVAASSPLLGSVSGRLLEAGRVVLEDGTVVLEGAGSSQSDPRFTFVRDVASLSPAAFMVRSPALRAALSSMTPIQSAAYATADLSFELRARGMRCLYQPLSRVLLDRQAEIGNLRDAQILAEKLQRLRLDRIPAARNLLVVDDHVPFQDRDAGSRRLGSLLRLARADGWSVVFGSLDKRGYQPYWEHLTQGGIEVKLGFSEKTLEELSSRGTRFDCVWLSRPQIAEAYLSAVRSTQPQAQIVYDTVDLHHRRLARQASVELRDSGAEEMERRELEAARRSDVVVVTGEVEKRVLQEHGISNVAVVGLSEVLADAVPSSKDRAGILFIGNYAHAPNVDAARWLAIEIMPLVWERIPGVKLMLAGTDPTAAVKRLANARVQVPGFISDLGPLLSTHRVFAAPMRFGAGIKGKILQAMAAGIPIVTTAIGAEGIVDEPDEMMIAGDAPSFAASVVDLCVDDGSWNRYSNGARRGVRRFSPAVQAEQLRGVLDGMKIRPALP